MQKVYVKLDEKGYVNEWFNYDTAQNLIRLFNQNFDDYELIESEEVLINNVECVKVENKIAVLDEKKQSNIREENKEILEQLEKEQEIYK